VLQPKGIPTFNLLLQAEARTAKLTYLMTYPTIKSNEGAAGFLFTVTVAGTNLNE
jgi:hypothetical protein